MYYITLYNYSQRFFPPGSVFRGAYLEPGHPGSSFKDGKKHQNFGLNKFVVVFSRI